jgi:hypothetical protein
MYAQVDVERKMKNGFNAGVTMEFPIKEVFSIDMGLILSTKGCKTSFNDGTLVITGTRNLVYLDIPLTAKAYYNAGCAKIYGAFGPYIGIGLGGKWKDKTTNSFISGTILSSSNAFDALKKSDIGLTAGAEVIINSFQIDFSYGYGLVNISTYSDVNIRNRVLGISVGCKFGGN